VSEAEVVAQTEKQSEAESVGLVHQMYKRVPFDCFGELESVEEIAGD
jgi:hypothetical protein